MLRLVTYAIIIILLAAGAVWLADRPGAVAVDWLGWHLETTVPILLVALLVLAAALLFMLRLLAGLARLPGHWAARREERRRRSGYQALADGMAAAAAGDAEKTRRLAGRAETLLEDAPLTRYLAAQAAQLSGDADGARDHYAAMLDRRETAALGTRGLLGDALRRGDEATAIELATKARRANPADRWLAETLFELLVKAGRLQEAQGLAADALRRQALPAAEAARRRCLVLNEQAGRAAADGEAGRAIGFAKQAVAADPAFLPAVLRLAGLYAEAGKRRRAAGLLESSWNRQPSLALADACARLVPGEKPIERLRRIERLVAGRPEEAVSHLALGEASLEAQLWGEARMHLLAALDREPSARAYRLLGKLEEQEYGDRAAAERWLEQAAQAAPDPVWLCAACGTTSGQWNLTCPHCGAMDRLEWASPRPPQARGTPGEPMQMLASAQGKR